MPPSDFRAYGVVVFKTRASSFDEERHLFICEAYANSLAHADEIGAPESQQMVTIWPVTKDDIADEINELPSTQACRAAVDNYGLVHALNALEILESYEAADGPYDTRGRGPFLVAWTPAASIAEPESVALLVDLSDVDRPEQAVEMMTLWRDRIQDNPQLWQDGVAKETFIDALRRFFDRNGALLEAVGSL